MIGLCFHGIGTPPAQLPSDAAGYFIGRDLFLAVLDAVVQRSEVSLTFDDGYASDTQIALPALVERGLSARFFPIAGQLGRPGYMDAEDVRALVQAGMPIGSHGMRHRSWRDLDLSAQHEELGAARLILEDAAGVTVATAACPFGDYDRRVLRALREHGYEQAFTSDRRRAQRGGWLQPRYSVRRGDTIATVRADILTDRPVTERMRRAAACRVKAWR